MGLDQYAFKVKKGHIEKPVNFSLPEGVEPEEISYWRKHPNLQGWMKKLWAKKGGEGEFNCVPVLLTEEDLDQLKKAVKKEKLPDTTGFFFGNDSDDYYYRTDLRFIENAKKALKEGYDVYYDSWW